MLKLIIFLKKYSYHAYFLSVCCYTIDFCLPLLLESFLRWIGELDGTPENGFTILLVIAVTLIARLIIEYQLIYVMQMISLASKNVLEVSSNSLIF